MPKNNLKMMRKQAAMTQKTLAEELGISQQHLQRLEAGTSPVRLGIAKSIAAILATSIEELFPELAKVVRRDHALLAKSDQEANRMIEEWADAGIDIDEGRWLVCWRMPSNYPIMAEVTGATARRLMDKVESNAKSGFLIFNSNTHRYAVALHEDVEISFERSSYDPERIREENLPLSYRRVSVYTSNTSSLRDYHPYPDECVIYQEVNKRWDMQALFEDLQMNSKPRVKIVTRYDDQTADEATTTFIPMASILTVEVPLSLVDPGFRKAMEEAK